MYSKRLSAARNPLATLNAYIQTKMPKFFHSKQWFPYLKWKKDRDKSECLLTRFPHLNTQRMDKQHIIICMNSHGTENTSEVRRWYAFFSSYLDLHSFLSSYPEEQNFFEVVLGSYPQRMRYDIDLGFSDEGLFRSIIQDVIFSIKRVFNQRGLKLDLRKDVIVFTSCNPIKLSAHIVFPRYYFSSNKECEYMFRRACKSHKEVLRYVELKYVDPSVYSSVQQFRLLGSSKPGSGRPKIMLQEWNFFGEIIRTQLPKAESQKHEELIRLEHSLLSWTAASIRFPLDFIPNKPRTKQYVKITEGVIEGRLDAILDSFQGEFEFRDIVGSIVNLNRLRPSYCETCEVVHDKENPFLLFTPDRVLFCCRRKDKMRVIWRAPKLQISEEIKDECRLSKDPLSLIDSLGRFKKENQEQLPRAGFLAGIHLGLNDPR